MKQLAVMLTTAVLFVLAVAAQAAEGAEPIRLRDAAVATGDGLVLGDLFAGLGPDVAARRVARAPAEGRSVRLEADWLVRVVRAHGIDWAPADRDAAIAVRRATEAERSALAEELRAALDDRMAADAPAAPAPAATGPRPGEVAMLSRMVRPGEVIATGDVAWVEMQDGPASAGMIRQAADIVGLSPRRPLAAGRPVRNADLRTPVLVERGAMITLILRTPTMTITARGRALDDAGRGDTIRVVNIDSNRTIEAVVTGPETAEVRAGSTIAATY